MHKSTENENAQLKMHKPNLTIYRVHISHNILLEFYKKKKKIYNERNLFFWILLWYAWPDVKYEVNFKWPSITTPVFYFYKFCNNSDY